MSNLLIQRVYALGINRNIVECKLVISWRVIKRRNVLIETLWNVNRFANYTIPFVGRVLIETLWNVNPRSTD